MTQDINSIIIRCPNWLGDAVMATPVFAHARKLFPHAHIAALAQNEVGELLEDIKDIDEYITFSRKKALKRKEEQRISKMISSFDLGILLTRSFSSAWMFWKGKVRYRTGYNDHFRSLLLNMPTPLPKNKQHDVLTYLDLLKPFGPSPENPKLFLCVLEEEKKAIRHLLTSLGIPEHHKIVVLNPGAAYGSAKCWPKKYFDSLITELAKKKDISLICIGNDSSLTFPDHVHNLIGKTSLRDLMALLSITDCLITNDSGPMHIGAALHTPLIALFGSTNPDRTSPWKHGIVLYKNVECSPCYKRACPIDFRCMMQITPQEVLGEIEKILS